MSEPIYDPSKSKLHYHVLQPGGYTTWFKDSERYHRSSGDWKWMEEDREGHPSWKSLIIASHDLKELEKRKELYEEEKVCGKVRLHTGAAYQEQTKDISTLKELYSTLKELASGMCHEKVEHVMKELWSTPWNRLDDCESHIVRYKAFFCALDDNRCTLPEGVYATALISSWPKSEVAAKRMLLAEKKQNLTLQNVYDEMRQISNRALSSCSSSGSSSSSISSISRSMSGSHHHQDTSYWVQDEESSRGEEVLMLTDEGSWEKQGDRKRARPRDRELPGLGNRIYLDMMKSIQDVPKIIMDKWIKHWNERHAHGVCMQECWMNLKDDCPSIIKNFVSRQQQSKKRKM